MKLVSETVILLVGLATVACFPTTSDKSELEERRTCAMPGTTVSVIAYSCFFRQLSQNFTIYANVKITTYNECSIDFPNYLEVGANLK